MTGPFAAHPGTHAVPRPSVFRSVMRLAWRKPAVPAGASAGTATALLDGPRPVPTFTPNARPLPRPVPPGWTAAWRDGVRVLVPPVRRQRGEYPYSPRQAVYGERPQLEVERDAAREAGERARVRYQPAPAGLLGQVLAGLRKL